MSTITRIPYNSTILDRLFSQMPSGFSSDPFEQDAVVFSAESHNLFKNAVITNVSPYITSGFVSPVIVNGSLVSNSSSSSFSTYRMTVQMTSMNSSTNTSPSEGQSFSAYISQSGKFASGIIESIIGLNLYVIIPDLSCFVNSQIPTSSVNISEIYCSSFLDTSKISLHIADSTLMISSDENLILSEHIDLEYYTIESLMYYFNDRYSGKSSQLVMRLAPNVSATLLSMSASVLSEGSSSFKNGSIVWPRFTSQNYSLLMMFALMLKTYKKLIVGAINQTDHRLATKDWLEHWGSILGVPRASYEEFALETSEPDIVYRERMRRETMLPKVSNESIKYLTSQATGRAISISDGGQPFLLYSSSNQVLNTLPVVVNKGYSSGEITVSETTVSGQGTSFLADFPFVSSGNYGKLIVDTKGYSEARQVSLVNSDTSLTLSSSFSNSYKNTPVHYDPTQSISNSSLLTSCMMYATVSSTTLTVSLTQFGTIEPSKTYTYDNTAVTFSGNSKIKSSPVSGYFSGTTFTVTNYHPATIVGTISGNILNVTSITSGKIVIGQLFSGTNVTENSIITAFGTGTGTLGTYYLSRSSSVPVGTIMTADASLIPGQKISGEGIPTEVVITAFGTGTGGIGTYTISESITLGSASSPVDNLIGFANQYTLSAQTTSITTPAWKLAKVTTPIFTSSSTLSNVPEASISGKTITVHSGSEGTAFVANQVINGAGILAGTTLDTALGITANSSASVSKWHTASFTATISETIMNVTHISNGGIEVGQNIFGAGVTTNSVVLAQLTGAAGDIGTYQLSLPSTIASPASLTSAVATAVFTATISGTTLDVKSILSGSLKINHMIYGYSKIIAIGTADSGGVGTYTIQAQATVNSPILMVSTILIGTGDFVYSGNDVLTPGLTLSGSNVTTGSRIVGPKIIAATTSGSLDGVTFTSGGSTSGTFASGYGLIGKGIPFGTFFVGSTTVSRIPTVSITGTPMIAVSGTSALLTSGSISKNVLTFASGGAISGTLVPGMFIFPRSSFTGSISTVSSVTTLTVTSASSSTAFAQGMLISGVGIPENTFVLSFGTGTTGGIGTYIVTYSPNLNLSSRTMTTEFVLPANTQIVSANYSTNSYVLSRCLPQGMTISSKQIYGWKYGPEWIVSAASTVTSSAITASTFGYQHKGAVSGTPAITDAAALSYFLGPSTGGGSFNVTVPLNQGESVVPQKVLSFVRLLISKYKPAGIPYTIN